MKPIVNSMDKILVEIKTNGCFWRVCIVVWANLNNRRTWMIEIIINTDGCLCSWKRGHFTNSVLAHYRNIVQTCCSYMERKMHIGHNFAHDMLVELSLQVQHREPKKWLLLKRTQSLILEHFYKKLVSRFNKMADCLPKAFFKCILLNDNLNILDTYGTEDCFQWTYFRYMMHYNDVIMSARASEITGASSVCSAVCSGADQRKHQSAASLAYWGEFTSDRWIPLTQGQ